MNATRYLIGVVIFGTALALPATAGDESQAPVPPKAAGVPEASALANGEAEGAEEGSAWSFGGNLEFNSRYLWRGMPYSRGPVFQPSGWVAYGPWSVCLWGNIDLEDEPNRSSFNEVDVTLTYTREWSGWTLEPSLNFYNYPTWRRSPSTAEASLKLSHPLGPFTASTSHTFDINEYQGSYFGDVSLAYERELGSRFTAQATACLGWGSSRFNEVYIGPRKTTLNVAELDLGVTCVLGHGWSARPHIRYAALLDGDLRQAIGHDSFVVFGLDIAAEF